MLDIKIAFAFPSGTTMNYGYSAASDAFRNAEFLENSATSSAIPMTADTPIVIHINGTIKTCGSAGNVTLQWAQAISNAAKTTVIKGSYLRADEI